MIVAVRRRLAAGTAMLAVASISLVLNPAAAPPGYAASGGYRALDAPARVLDTRPAGVTADGAHAGSGAVAGETTYTLPLAGRVGLPADMAAVVLNVTVTEPAAAGFVTAYPCGGAVPTASNVNYLAGQTVPNAVVAAPGAGGAVCLFAKSTTHLVVDVAGWFTPGGYSALSAPARLYDSRPGRPTIDNQQAGEGLSAAETETRVVVAGRAGLGAPDSVVLNVTATETHAAGFITVYPCSPDGVSARPNASNLNYAPGQTVANSVVARVGAGGAVCLFTKSTAHLIVDAAGALPAASFTPLPSPQRLLDTRPTGATVDGQFQGFGSQPAGASLQLDVDRAGIPATASAVVLNVTAVAPHAAGYLTTHPRGTPRPVASNVNHAAGQTVANAVVARLGRDGQICLFNLAPTDVLVDVAGYLTGPPPPTTGGDCPATAPGGPGGAQALLARPPLHRAIGTDRIAVVVCRVPGGSQTFDAAAIANWANQTVSPWFTEASRGTFHVAFEPAGSVDTTHGGGCADAAIDIAGPPFTNVIGVTNDTDGGGFGSPGNIWPHIDVDVLSAAPSETGRFAVIGGAEALVNPSVFVHEIGHTIHWPHSYVGQGDEYNNPIDVMSGEPGASFDSEAMCDVISLPGFKTPCWPQHTLAFNRVAAGWVADSQVTIHRSGWANYALDAPAGDGAQLIALPDPADPKQLLTIEARPAAGRDRFNQVGGVAVHLIDQSALDWTDGISLQRRQAQATGEPYSYDHVVPPGATLSVHGVTLTVHGTAGAGYSVAVGGTYRSPGPIADDRPVLVTQSVGPDGPFYPVSE